MSAFTQLHSRTLVLRERNIDTDQIIPARFLTTTERQGLGQHAFSDWRTLPDGTITFANDLFLAAMTHRQRADAGDCCSVGRHRPGAGGRAVARHRRRQPGAGIILANLMRRPP